jgi:hypothetical protein
MRIAVKRLLAVALIAPFVMTACDSEKGPSSPPPFSPQMNLTVKNVTISKTAEGYRRKQTDYDWTLEKSVTPSTAELGQGASATFNYTLTATRTEVSTSAEQTGVTGQICLRNDNTISVTVVKVEDILQHSLNGGSTWQDVLVTSVPLGGHTTLAAGETHCYPYDIPFTPIAGRLYRNWGGADIIVNGSPGQPETIQFPNAVTFPSAVTIAETDESATLNDVLSCPTGFSCVGGGPNGEVLTGTSIKTYGVQVTNVNAPCDSDHELKNSAVLTENDSNTPHNAGTTSTITTPDCAPSLSARKTATATYRKWVAYDWTVEKTVSPASAEIAKGGSATFSYTVTATRVVASMSEALSASGEVCVSNNGDGATTGLAISDVLQHSTDGGATWTTNNSTNVDVSSYPNIPAGGSHCYPYSISFTKVDGAQYRNHAVISATNGGSVNADAGFTVPAPVVEETDESASLGDSLDCPQDFTCSSTTHSWSLGGSQTFNYNVTVTNANAPCKHTTTLDNTATLREGDSGTTHTDEASAVITTPDCETTGGFQGCTPGYWKQKQHFGSWIGYIPTGPTASKYNTVFGVTLFSANTTLLDALGQGGGGANRFGRHSTAALLNTANSGVAYGMTTAQVIAAVQAAVASGNLDAQSDIFEKLNERRCPLGRSE